MGLIRCYGSFGEHVEGLEWGRELVAVPKITPLVVFSLIRRLPGFCHLSLCCCDREREREREPETCDEVVVDFEGLKFIFVFEGD